MAKELLGNGVLIFADEVMRINVQLRVHLSRGGFPSVFTASHGACGEVAGGREWSGQKELEQEKRAGGSCWDESGPWGHLGW